MLLLYRILDFDLVCAMYKQFHLSTTAHLIKKEGEQMQMSVRSCVKEVLN